MVAPSRISHRSDEQHTLTGTQASAAAAAAEDASAGSRMHEVAIERVARMLAHHACVAATRAPWPVSPRAEREKTLSAGAGSAITWVCTCSAHAVYTCGAHTCTCTCTCTYMHMHMSYAHAVPSR